MADASTCLFTDDGDQNSTQTIRVVGLFAILVSSAIGVWLPWITSTRNLQLPTFFGTVFAAGIVLATGFVHILPDGDDAFKNPCLGFSGTYPWASTIAGGSVLLIFTIEYFLRQIIRRKLGLPDSFDAPGHAHGLLPEAGTALANGASSSTKDRADAIEVGAQPSHGTLKCNSDRRAPLLFQTDQVEALPTQKAMDPHSAALAENSVAAAMLELGIVFHSVFVGIDLGITTETSSARALMIALIFHQAFEGLALGAALVRAECSVKKFTVLAVVFCLVTPFGVAIGLGMGSSYNDNSKVALGFSGAFNSVSAGILIYNGLVDLVVPIFTFNNLLKGRLFLQLVAIFLLFAGYSCMALLGKWA